MEYFDARRMFKTNKYSFGYEKTNKKVEAYSRTPISLLQIRDLNIFKNPTNLLHLSWEELVV